MRNPYRIDPFLAEFAELWKKNPDLRFGQLVSNLQCTVSSNPDPFYTEDDIMLNAIRNMAGTQTAQDFLEKEGVIPRNP